jgi:hypothetical protein
MFFLLGVPADHRTTLEPGRGVHAAARPARLQSKANDSR